jgi:hypothetical protein
MAFIDAKKLLNASDEGGKIAKVSQPKMFLVPVKNTEYKQTVDLSEQIDNKDLSDPERQVVEDIKVIREKVVKIEDILKKTIKINVKKIQLRAKQDENKKRKDQEDKLEQKKEKKKGPGLPNIPIPGMSIFDRIKQFLGTIFTGFLVLRIFRLLPKLIEFLDYIKPVTAFIEDFVKGMFDKFVTTIDFGYKLVDGAQSKIKELFGDGGEKKFSEFTSTFTKFMNLAIIAGMATMGGEDPLKDKRFKGPERRGFDRSGRRVNERIQQRYRKRFGDQRYGDRFGNRNLRRLRGQTPRATQGLDQRLVQRGVTRVAGKGAGRIAGKLPIVGPLIDFGIRTLVFKEPLGKAAAGAVGAGVGQALGAWVGGAIGGVAGSVVPIIGNLLAGAAGATIGGLIGGLIGDQIGVSLYNVITKSSPDKIEARARGGRVGYKGRRDPGLKYGQKKKRRAVPITKLKVDKTTPGVTTGQKKIKDLYATTDFNKQPVRNLVSAAEMLKQPKTSVFSKIMSMGVDLMLGQRPSKTSQRNVAKAFAGLFASIQDPSSNSISNEITRAIQALASGGEILSDNRDVKRKNESILGLMKGIENALARDLSVLNAILNIRANPRTDPTQPGGGAPGAKLRGGSNAQIEADLLEYFTAIYGKNAAIGIVANIRRESGYRTATPDNSRFEGMVQWSRNDRWPKFVKWAEERGLDPYNRNVQAQYIAVDINNHGIDGELRSASSPEAAASIFYNKFERGAHSKPVKGSAYDPNNAHENLNKQFIADITGRNPNIGSRGDQVVVYPRTGGTGYKPRSPGLFNAVEYITGDSTQGSNYDEKDHGGGRYHEHIAFKTIADKERAKKALRAAGFEIGSEYRSDSNTYHGANLAIDIPLYKPSGGGVQKGYADNATGEKKFSAEVRKILGIDGGSSQPSRPTPAQLGRVIRSSNVGGTTYTEREGGKYFQNGKPISKDLYDAVKKNHPSSFGTQASIAPTRPNSGSIASLNQRASYDTDGTTHIFIVEVV